MKPPPLQELEARSLRLHAALETGSERVELLRARSVSLDALPSKAGATVRDFIVTLPGDADTKLLFDAFAEGAEAEPACLLSGLWPHEENLETVFERIVAGEAGGGAND